MGNWMSPYFRLGVKHVSNEHLARMVDLTHALDPAPWTVDCNMKAGVGPRGIFPRIITYKRTFHRCSEL